MGLHIIFIMQSIYDTISINTLAIIEFIEGI